MRRVATGIALFGFAVMAAVPVRAERFCDFPGDYAADDPSQWLDFFFQGRRFSMPAAYVDFPGSYQGGRKQTGFLGRVRIPDFAPMPYPETRGKIAKELRDWATLLITDFLPLDVVVGRIAGSPSDPDFFDLRVNDFEHRPGPYSLIEVVPENASTYNAIYFYRNKNGSTQSVFLCRKQYTVPRPDCTHAITASNYDVKLSYERERLEHWREYDGRARDFVACALMRGHDISQNEQKNRSER